MRYAKIVQEYLGDGITKLSIREGKDGDGRVLTRVTTASSMPSAITEAREELMSTLVWDGYKPVRSPYGGDVLHWEREDQAEEEAAAETA